MEKTMKPFICALITVAVLTAGPVFAANGDTDVMNSHGESMVLDFNLYDKGQAEPINYTQFGTFENVGTDKYQYKITDRKGLAAAVGEGVYPNNSVYKDPAYRLLVSKGKLAGSQWEYVNIEDQQLAFYKWATSHDTPGVQQFYTALALEKLGETEQAIKAYYSVIINFPNQVGWTFWHTPIYVSRLAIDKIDFLTRQHPELGLKLEGVDIRVENGYDFNVSNDKYFVNPGHFVKVAPADLKPKKIDLNKLKITQTIKRGEVELVEYENGHWQMLVDGKPFMVKGIAYAPTPLGKSAHEGYDPNNAWMKADVNNNGKIDGPDEAWIDLNKNNAQDPDEPTVGDFAILKKMGVNTLRLYHHAADKEILRRLLNCLIKSESDKCCIIYIM
jgi:beta-glucuronidase